MPDQPGCLCDKMTGFANEGRMRDVIYINFSKTSNIAFSHALAHDLGHLGLGE